MNDNERAKYLKILKKLDQEKPGWNVFDFSWASGLTIQAANKFVKENIELARAKDLEEADATNEEIIDETEKPVKQTKTGTKRTGSKTTLKENKE